MAKGRVVFDGINIVVRDMDAALDFYRILGLEIPDTLPEWQAHHRTPSGVVDPGGDPAVDVDLDSGAFASQWNEGWPASRSGVVVGFRVATREDVDQIYQELTDAGHVGQQPPYDAFWGARYAILEDPSGNAVGLMSPIDPERRTQPSPPSP